MDPWASIGHLKKQEVQSLQNKKLHSFVNNYLYPFSAHYRKVFDDNKVDPRSIKTVDDLRRIPFVSKVNFKEDKFRDFVLTPDKEKINQFWPLSKKLPLLKTKIIKGQEALDFQLSKEFRPVFITYTTGTTSDPIPFVYTNYDMNNLHVSGARMLNLFQIKNTEKVVNMFPYAPHLAFWQVVSGGLASNTVILSTGGGKVMGTDGNIKVLVNMKPSVILGVPSYVYHVLRTAKEDGLDLSSIKKIVLGASKVTKEFKIRLAELVEACGGRDVCVFGTYGFTEARCAWAESPTALDVSSGYHLYPDKEIFEVVDPDTGEVKAEGEDGELVYTSIDSRGSAVIRYRTGDFVKGGITYEKCASSGLTVPRISSDITRLSNVKDLQLSKVKGSLVNFNNFDTILSEIKQIEEWQLVLQKKNNDPFDVDEVVVYVCSQKGCDQEGLTQTIKKQMLSGTEISPNAIHYVEMSEMVKRLGLETENKEKRILDKRSKDSK